VADQEAESKRLIDYIGLDWDEDCLRFLRVRSYRSYSEYHPGASAHIQKDSAALEAI